MPKRKTSTGRRQEKCSMVKVEDEESGDNLQSESHSLVEISGKCDDGNFEEVNTKDDVKPILATSDLDSEHGVIEKDINTSSGNEQEVQQKIEPNIAGVTFDDTANSDNVSQPENEQGQLLAVKQERLDDDEYGAAIGAKNVNSNDCGDNERDINSDIANDKNAVKREPSDGNDVEVTAIKQEPIDDSVDAPVVVKPDDSAASMPGTSAGAMSSSRGPAQPLRSNKPQHAFLQQIMASRGASITSTMPGQRLFHCEHCPEQFTQYAQLVQHCKHRHYKCHLCGKVIHKSHMSPHLRLHDREQAEKEIKESNDQSSSSIKTSDVPSKLHAPVHPQILQCNRCHKICASAMHLKRHQLTHVPLKCKICRKVFTQSSYLRMHEAKHLNPVIHYCKICGKGWSTKQSLIFHMRAHAPKCTEKKHKCESCNQAFFFKSKLQQHMWVHNSNRQFKCELCHKKYKSPSHLKLHNLSHSDRFKCNICFATFYTAVRLAHHKRSTHYSQAKFRCLQCPSFFKHPGLLTQHQKLRHSAVSKPQ